MDRIFILFLCINLLAIPAFAEIVDEFVLNTLSKKQEVKGHNVEKNYIDDVYILRIEKVRPIEHETVVITDDFLPKIPASQTRKRVYVRRSADAESVAVSVKIKNYLTTKSQPEEGSYIYFETVSPVKLNNVVYPAGTDVKARIETVAMNKSMGVPADLIIGNFSINNLPLEGEIKKIGANRSLWVYPCEYIGSMFFFAGLLFIPIRGGHAKINTNKTFTLYFEQ